jgi:hypothetical protein
MVLDKLAEPELPPKPPPIPLPKEFWMGLIF